MSRKIITIARILLLIIITIIIGIGIGIGISIASAQTLGVAELHLNARADRTPATELRGLAVRGGDVLLEHHSGGLATAEQQVLQLDVHNLL